MADNLTPPTIPIVPKANVAPFKYDTAKVEAKFQEIRNFLQGFVGRPGYNPFYSKYVLEKLEARHNDGETTQGLFNEVMNFEKREPIAKGAEHNIKNPPREAQAAGASNNAGQSVLSQQAGMMAGLTQTKIAQD